MYISCVSLNYVHCQQHLLTTTGLHWLPKDSPLTSKAHQSDFRHYQSCEFWLKMLVGIRAEIKAVAVYLTVRSSGCSAWSTKSRLWGYKPTKIEGTMFSLVTVAALFLVCLPPEAVSQQCRSGVTDEIRQSVREQLRQGGENGTIPTVAVNCDQVRLVAKCAWVHICSNVVVAWLSRPAKSATLQVQCGCMIVLPC